MRVKSSYENIVRLKNSKTKRMQKKAHITNKTRPHQ